MSRPAHIRNGVNYSGQVIFSIPFGSSDTLTIENTSSGFTGYRNALTRPYADDNDGTPVTKNGMTFTIQPDGRISVDGANTEATDFFLWQEHAFDLPNGEYQISGHPEDVQTDNGGSIKIVTYDENSNVISEYFSTTNDGKFKKTDDVAAISCCIHFGSTQITASDWTYAPMLKSVLNKDSEYVEPNTIPALSPKDGSNSILGKISAMFSNIRKLWNTVGTDPIPSELGSTITGALQNVQKKGTGITTGSNYMIIGDLKISWGTLNNGNDQITYPISYTETPFLIIGNASVSDDTVHSWLAIGR